MEAPALPGRGQARFSVLVQAGRQAFNRGDAETAILSWREAQGVAPEQASAWVDLGSAFSALGHMTEAQACYRKALELEPRSLSARALLAQALHEQGNASSAAQYLHELLKLAPGNLQVRSNFLTTLQYVPGLSDEVHLRQAELWGELAQRNTEGEIARPSSSSMEGRPLRIGFVSGDLCAHPVGFLLHPLLANLEPGSAVPILYSNGSRKDWMQSKLQITLVQRFPAQGAWREVEHLSDEQLAAMIREDRIDVLFDLSGHTGRSRLAMFARRPAPLQLSWCGYFATTGLGAIDAVIFDWDTAPPGVEEQFTEQVVRLPHTRWVYEPLPFAPPVSRAPCEANGLVTFGSFNNTAKLNQQVIASWAAILLRVPQSRMVLKWRTFADEAFKEAIAAAFEAKGVDPARLEFREFSVHKDVLSQYADIDVALDTFPFTGGYTSLEALWMGVPVITLRGHKVVQRQTFAALNQINLPELATVDTVEYVATAVELAQDPERIQSLRETLRARMSASPLCDGQSFARTFMATVRDLFNERCASV